MAGGALTIGVSSTFQLANFRTKAKNLCTVEYDVGFRVKLDACSSDMELMRLISCFETKAGFRAKLCTSTYILCM